MAGVRFSAEQRAKAVRLCPSPPSAVGKCRTPAGAQCRPGPAVRRCHGGVRVVEWLSRSIPPVQGFDRGPRAVFKHPRGPPC
jgi:hypothetical protein